MHDVYGVGVKLLRRLKLNFSQLNKYKVRHGFKNEIFTLFTLTQITLFFAMPAAVSNSKIRSP